MVGIGAVVAAQRAAALRLQRLDPVPLVVAGIVHPSAICEPDSVFEVEEARPGEGSTLTPPCFEPVQAPDLRRSLRPVSERVEQRRKRLLRLPGDAVVGSEASSSAFDGHYAEAAAAHHHGSVRGIARMHFDQLGVVARGSLDVTPE